ncbi:hypothetical protein MOQ_007666, partial [Trypanosoma cruzi marinkellei]
MGPEKRNPRRLPGHFCTRKASKDPQGGRPRARRGAHRLRLLPRGPGSAQCVQHGEVSPREKIPKSEGRPGIEPGYSEPQSDVLPLNYLPAAPCHNSAVVEDFSAGDFPLFSPFFVSFFAGRSPVAPPFGPPKPARSRENSPGPPTGATQEENEGGWAGRGRRPPNPPRAGVRAAATRRAPDSGLLRPRAPPSRKVGITRREGIGQKHVLVASRARAFPEKTGALLQITCFFCGCLAGRGCRDPRKPKERNGNAPFPAASETALTGAGRDENRGCPDGGP